MAWKQAGERLAVWGTLAEKQTVWDHTITDVGLRAFPTALRSRLVAGFLWVSLVQWDRRVSGE